MIDPWLSTLTSVNDPLGLISPFILVGKQIIQEMCRNQIDWDIPIPQIENSMGKWRIDLQQFLAFLTFVKQLNLPQTRLRLLEWSLQWLKFTTVWQFTGCFRVYYFNYEMIVVCLCRKNTKYIEQTWIKRPWPLIALIGKQSIVPVIHREIFQPESKETIGLILQAKKILFNQLFTYNIYSQNDTLPEMWGIILKKMWTNYDNNHLNLLYTT